MTFKQKRVIRKINSTINILAICIFLLYKFWLLLLILTLLIVTYFIIRKRIDMDLYSKFQNQLLYYDGKNNKCDFKLENSIYRENDILHILMQSKIPMYIMHDVKLECDQYKTQIDFIVATKRNIYFIESKRIDDRTRVPMRNFLRQFERNQNIIKYIFKKEKIRADYNIFVVYNNDYSYNKIQNNIKYKDLLIRDDKLLEELCNVEYKSHVKRQEVQIKKICDKILKYDILFRTKKSENG